LKNNFFYSESKKNIFFILGNEYRLIIDALFDKKRSTITIINKCFYIINQFSNSMSKLIAIIIIWFIITISIYSGMLSIDFGFSYARQNIDSDTTNNNIINLHNILTKQVKVGDIDIFYKAFGKGDPILLIMGYSGSMYSWDPVVLKELSTNHTVIVFDNRGIGNTTIGSKNFTIEQFAADTAGLLDALKINKSDVLGFSMGGMIAQQLTVNYPDKVDDLIIYASYCGENQSIPLNQEIFPQKINLSESASDDVKKRLVPLLFTPNWIKQNPHYLEKFASSDLPPIDILERQGEAIVSWEGVCDQLKDISQDTLVVTGTNDLIVPSANSLMLVEGIPGAWLAQFKDGGHALMYQYPEKLSEVINTFLDN
jgi:pimeloyl-ACP methyl ester carboxylesterase